MDSIIIYTDGGCRGNPGPGGWAYILKTKEIEKSESGGDNATTNNKMELTAVIRSMEAILNDSELSGRKIELHTDSQYVKNGISSWINNWIKNGWMTTAGKPVKNKDLWMELKKVSDQLTINWKWVKGHAGNPLNEACDQMVGEEINNIMTGNPLDLIKEMDIELFENVGNTGRLSLENGALSKKHKLLIALALDASHGASEGVHSLAMQALANGATKEEIMETVRVTNFISGVGSVYTAANGLKGIL